MSELEDAVAAGGDSAKLRDKITKAFSPDEIEQLRAKLYEASSNGNKAANRFLAALPKRGSPLQRQDARGTAGEKDPDEPSPPLKSPIPKTPKDIAMGAHRFLDQAFPTDKGYADAVKNDPMTNAAAQTAMLAPLAAPYMATLGRAAGGVGEFIGGQGGRIASGLTKVAGGAGAGAGGAMLTGGDPKAGAIMGTLMAVPGGALDVMNSPLLPTSDVIAATEAGGGKIGFRGATGLRAPEAQGLPMGREGDVELGVRGQQRILGDIEARKVANKAAIEAGENAAIESNGDQPVDTTRMRAKLAAIAKSRMTDTGMVVSPRASEALAIDKMLQRPGVPGVRVVGGARGAAEVPTTYEPLEPHGGNAGSPATSPSYNPMSVRGGAEGGRSSGVRYDSQGRMILPTEEISSGVGAHVFGGEMIPGPPESISGMGATPSGGRMIRGSDPVLSGQGARYETVPGKPLNEISLRDAIAIKKGLRDRANFDGPATPESAAARVVAGELSDIGHGADPTYDAALTRYADESTKIERANDVFGGRPTQELPDRASIERNMQKRIGELGRDPYLTRQALEVAAQNPEWRDLINAAIARNGLKLQFGGGGSPQSSAFRTVMGDAQALALRLSPVGRASNANYPLIPLETALIEGARKRREDARKAKSRPTFLNTDEGVE